MADAVGTAIGGGRNTVAFVNNGFTGGDIGTVINKESDQFKAGGVTVKILSEKEDLLTTCRSSIRGVSSCYGAAVFYGSPTQGPGGIWNYSLRADGGLGNKIDTTNANNDEEVYVLPLQHAIDFAIARQNTTIDQSVLPDQVYEYPYRTETQE